MKKLLLIALLSASFSGAAQTFQWDTNDTIEANLAPNTTVQYPTYQSVVNPNDTVTLAIEVIYNDLPSAWDGMVCIYGLCLGTIPNVGTTATMDPIYGSTQGMVRLTVNPYNGTEVAKLQIYVYDVEFPNDGDTATFLLNQTLGVDDLTAPELNIGPNPAQEYVQVQFDETMESIQVIDASGSIVRTVNINGTESTVDIADLPKGMYTLKVMAGTVTASRRIVKQ